MYSSLCILVYNPGILSNKQVPIVIHVTFLPIATLIGRKDAHKSRLFFIIFFIQESD